MILWIYHLPKIPVKLYCRYSISYQKLITGCKYIHNILIVSNWCVNKMSDSRHLKDSGIKFLLLLKPLLYIRFYISLTNAQG